MDKKLTDSEIISDLGHLIKFAKAIGVDMAYSVEVSLLINALDLINRLQSKLIKEQNKNSKLRNERNRLQAENEMLLQELQHPQADTVQPMSEENIVHCKECKHLMFSDFDGECSKGYKGIVRPNDSCPFGVRERGESK